MFYDSTAGNGLTTTRFRAQPRNGAGAMTRAKVAEKVQRGRLTPRCLVRLSRTVGFREVVRVCVLSGASRMRPSLFSAEFLWRRPRLRSVCRARAIAAAHRPIAVRKPTEVGGGAPRQHAHTTRLPPRFWRRHPFPLAGKPPGNCRRRKGRSLWERLPGECPLKCGGDGRYP